MQTGQRILMVWMAVMVLSIGLTVPAEARSFIVQFFGPSEITHDVDEALRKLDLIAEDFTCFSMAMRDPETGRTLGKGVDCLDFDGLTPDPALAVDAVSFFMFRQGTIVTKGKTSLQPFVPGFGDGGNPPRTHITGSIPSGPTIIHGTKAFKQVKGVVRLSGAVALSETGNPFFDCLWVVNVRKLDHDELE